MDEAAITGVKEAAFALMVKFLQFPTYENSLASNCPARRNQKSWRNFRGSYTVIERDKELDVFEQAVTPIFHYSVSSD